jgi:hypothetical protein
MKRLLRADLSPVARHRISSVRDETVDEPIRRGGVAVHFPRLPTVLEGVAALLAAFAFSVFLTWPLLREFGDHIYGLGGDSTGSMAGFRLWAEEIGYRITGSSHVASAGAPFGYDQGNGVNLQSAFVFFPAYLITEAATEIVAYNVAVLSGLVLSGAVMYWLVRWLGCGPFIAAWSGLAFIVFPWHLEKAQGHPSLAHLEGFPLLLLAVLAWYRKPDLVRALMIALASAVLWTTSGYFGFMGTVALGAFFVIAAVLLVREVGVAQAMRRLVAPGVASVAVPLVVYGVASRGASEDGIATPRNLDELVFYGARPWEYIIPSHRNSIFGDEVAPWLVAHLHGSNFSETSLYVGWITIALAAGWLLWALASRSRLFRELRYATLALTATVIAGLLFSLPTPFFRTDVPTPVRLIWEVAPQFRVPARFVALVMAALVPLAALGLNRLALALRGRFEPGVVGGVVAGGACVLAGVLSFLELSTSSVTLTNLRTAPPEYAAVRAAPRGLLAEYPLAASDQAVNSDYLFWQRAHGRRLVNGAPQGTFADAVRQTLVDPRAPGTPEALAALGTSVVVVRPSAYAFTGGPTMKTTVVPEGYRPLARTSSGAAVWRVTARPTPAIAAFSSGFHAPETIKPGSTMRWMADEGRVELLSTRAGDYEATFTVASYGRTRTVRVRGTNGSRSVVAPPKYDSVSIRLSLPRGYSSLTVSADPGSERLPDGRQATVYISNWRLELLLSTEPRSTAPEPVRAAPI